MDQNKLTDAATRIDEAHGLWEMSVARLAALVEASAKPPVLKAASADERDAFTNWKRISREVGA